jgi:primosomal protein N''
MTLLRIGSRIIPSKWFELYKVLCVNDLWKSKSYLAILKQVIEELGDCVSQKEQVETLNTRLRYDRSLFETDLIRLQLQLDEAKAEIYCLRSKLQEKVNTVI